MPRHMQSYVAPHKKEVRMIARIERLLDALFAPLAREIGRMPPKALRFDVFF
jgi:hypothetical protein